MDFGILDRAQELFLGALRAGTLSLGAYSIALLGACSIASWYWQFGRSLAMGGGSPAEALAAALYYAVRVGLIYWIVMNLAPMTEALYQTFLMWGQSVGGTTAAQALLTPSSVASIGFAITAPIDTFIQGHSGWATMWNLPQLGMYGLVNLALLLVFPIVACALMVTQIEFSLSVMLGAILIPFAGFGPTTFLAEFCIGWIVGSAVRVLTIAAIVGLGFPLFGTVNLPVGPAGNPTFFGAVVMLVVGALYCGMACVIPAKASQMCGRATLALTSAQLLSASMGAGAAVVGAAQLAVRGTSQLLQGRRT